MTGTGICPHREDSRNHCHHIPQHLVSCYVLDNCRPHCSCHYNSNSTIQHPTQRYHQGTLLIHHQRNTCQRRIETAQCAWPMCHQSSSNQSRRVSELQRDSKSHLRHREIDFHACSECRLSSSVHSEEERRTHSRWTVQAISATLKLCCIRAPCRTVVTCAAGPTATRTYQSNT